MSEAIEALLRDQLAAAREANRLAIEALRLMTAERDDLKVMAACIPFTRRQLKADLERAQKALTAARKQLARLLADLEGERVRFEIGDVRAALALVNGAL